MRAETADDGDGRAAQPVPGHVAWPRVRKGQLVRSRRGRDAGRWYLVVECSPDGFMYVADGVKRTMQRPKRKNPKHLLVYDVVAEHVGRSLEAGRKVSDEEVQHTLAELVSAFVDRGEEVDDTGEARCD